MARRLSGVMANNATNATGGDDDGDVPSSEMLLVGILLGTFASIGINIGQNMQADGIQTLPEEDQMKPWKSRVWIIGNAIFISCSIVNFAALGQAPASVLVPLESIQFVTNVAYSRIVKKAVIPPKMMLGVALAMCGTVLTVVFGAAGGDQKRDVPCIGQGTITIARPPWPCGRERARAGSVRAAHARLLESRCCGTHALRRIWCTPTHLLRVHASVARARIGAATPTQYEQLTWAWSSALWWVYLVLTIGIALVCLRVHKTYDDALKAGEKPKYHEFVLPVLPRRPRTLSLRCRRHSA